MTEELKVKLTVDTSGVNSALSKVKNSFKTVSSAGSGAAGASEKMEASMEQVQQSLEKIKNLNAFELLSKGIDRVNVDLTDMTGHIKNAFAALNKNSKLYKTWGVEWEGMGEGFEMFKLNLKEAKDSFKEMGKEARNTLDEIIPRGAQKAVAVLLTVYATVKTVGAAIRNSFNVAAEVKNLVNEANKLNMSAKAYQEWAYILERQGVGADKLADFMKTLADEQNAVREGSEDIIAAFAKIGISAQEAASMSQEQLFKKVVKNLQNVEDQTQKVSIAYKIFGEDAAELNNVINLTNAETASLANNLYLLGGAMSESLIQKSTALSSAVSSLKTAWTGLTYTLAELFMPIITKIVNWLTKAIAVINMFLRTIFGLELTPSSTATEGATGGMNAYTESVESATAAVNKLKRVTMGFDELNIVRDPNTASDSNIAGGTGVPNFSVGEGLDDSMLNPDKFGLGKIRDWFETYKNTIQDITTWSLIGIGAIGAVLCLLHGNWAGALAFAAMAGIGFAVGNVEDGTFDRLRAKFEEMNLGFVPIAMTGIGAIGAVIALLMGNIPAAIGLATMAGIGFSLSGGTDGIKSFLSTYESDIKALVLPSMVGIGAVGAVLALMFGNIPAAIALGAMAGIGFALSNSSNISDFVSRYASELSSVRDACMVAIGMLGVVMCMLTGNIPGALIFAAIGGIALANITTGGTFYEDAIGAIQSAWGSLSKWFNTSVKPVFTKEYWYNIFEPMRQATAEKFEAAKQKIIEKWNFIKNWFNQSVKPKFTLAYWNSVFESVRQAAATKFEETKKKIQEKWENIRVWFNQTVKPKLTLSYWQGLFENVRKGAALKLQEVRKSIEGIWANITTWFRTKVSKVFTINYWKTKFESIKSGFRTGFNGIIAIAEKAVNNIIAKINTLSWKIPSWVPSVGNKSFGFNFKSIKIPRLATGGIAVSSTLANIGENGREAVLPLDRNTEWMDRLADKIAARNNTPSKIVLKVGEREIGWAAINGINQVTKQTGGLQLQLV